MLNNNNNPKVVGIIQARMNSKRLPNKVMLHVVNKPLIQHMIERVKKSKMISELWLAIPNSKDNDCLKEICKKTNIFCYAGSHNDVLSRFVKIGSITKADLIVRLTGDCPLHDPKIIDLAIKFAINNINKFDYIGNALKPTYPDGLDVEVFSFNVLKKAEKRAKSPIEKEHVTPLIHNFHDKKFTTKIGHFYSNIDYSHLRWTLDEKEDYEFIKSIYEELYPINPFFSWGDIILLLNKKKYLTTINSKFKRNEGFNLENTNDN